MQQRLEADESNQRRQRCNTAYRVCARLTLRTRALFEKCIPSLREGKKSIEKHCSPKRVWIVWTIPGRNTSGERYACRRRASCRAVDFPLRCWRASWRAGILRDGAALCNPGSTSRGISTLRDTRVRTRRCRAVHKFLTRLAHAKLSPRKMLRRMDENT